MRMIAMFSAMTLFFALAVPHALHASGGEPGEMICNGAAEYCARGYNEVTYPGTHNSMSNRDDGWHFPNQVHGIERQLEDGVRAFLIDIYYHRGGIYMCHRYCELGMRPLQEGLAAIKDFMDRNPGEVITIDFQSACEGKDVVPVFERIGLDEYALPREPGDPWPTLGEMVRSGKRLVVFGGWGGGAPWYLRSWDHMWSSDYDFQSISKFTCGKPPEGGLPVYELQHFAENPMPNLIYSEKVNSEKVILKRARQCWRQWGRRPTFIAVDFYSVGDLFESVKKLNEMSEP